MLRFLLGLVCLFAWASPSQASPWSIGPVGGWVELEDPPGASEELSSTGGYRALLHDEQVFEGSARHARFSRRVFLLESVEGARIFDGVSTDFDPSWQKVTLHWVRILRAGKVLDRLDPAKIHLLSREDRLEEGQIDGWRTLHLVLEDLRPGDVLDYAWTIEGTHPALGQVAAGSFHFQLPWVAERLRSRLVWDRTDSLRTKGFHGAPKPEESRRGSWRILTWDLAATEAYEDPEGAPEWWTDVPSVDWTNLEDWNRLARIQLSFYAPIDRPEPAVVELAQRLKARYLDSPSRIAGTLRYLQDSIRYLGYEGGMGSHVPRPAGITLKARQGDCKDKSLMMSSLLRLMGIEAHPTLVLTSGDRELDQRLPSPWFFNHVVVTVSHGGRTWVLDPTDQDQRGPLEAIPQVESRWSLILEPASAGLVAIAPKVPILPGYDLVESWDASAGPRHPATLSRRVVRRGRVAEGFRSRLARSSFQEEVDAELDLLRKSWPDLVRKEEPSMVDDSLTGEILWTSSFLCDSFWYESSSSRVWKFDVGSRLVEDALVDPTDTAGRSAPLAVTHPAGYRVRVGVKLPAHPWVTDADSTSLDLGPLAYRFHRVARRDTFGLEWSWTTSDDHVEVADLHDWARAMDSLRTETTWTITLDRRSPISKLNWPVSILLFAVFCAAAAAAVAAWRWNPDPKPSQGDHRASGWWGLYALGLVSAPVLHGYNLWQAKWIFDPSLWSSQFDQNPEASLAVLLSMVCQAAWMPAMVLLAVLFLGRRTSFPVLNLVLFTAILTVEMSLGSVLLVLQPQDALEHYARNVGRIPAVVVWSVYFLVARRSKAVFCRKLSESSVAAPTGIPDSKDASRG